MNQSSVQSMKRRWQSFAESDPTFYIATRAQPWKIEEFFASGQSLVEEVNRWIGEDSPRRRMLEIGCGLGRTAVHFATHFEQVDAVDISHVMIENARSFKPPANVRFMVCSGCDLAAFADDSMDLVASFLVFQHVEDEQVIAAYLREIARVLKAAGRAVLQFDTRPRRLILDLYKSLPDPLLPRAHRRCIRRYRRDPDALSRLFQSANLRIIDDRGPRTAEHVFLLGPMQDRDP